MDRSTYPPVSRIVAIGDIHGDYKALLLILRKAKLINKSNNWIGRNTYLVQLGDQVDSLCRDNSCALKDPQELKIMLFLNQLDQEARVQKGRVISLLGNHEMMNMQGDFRYASKVDLKVMGGEQGRESLFKPGGQLARVLSKTRHAIAKIGDYVFVHGGFLPRHTKYSFDQINNIAKRFMLGEAHLENTRAFRELFEGPHGILWTRAYSTEYPRHDQISYVNKKLGIKSMVVGHTVQDEGINSAVDGKVWRVDTGMSRAFGHRRKIQALEILNNGEKIRIIK